MTNTRVNSYSRQVLCLIKEPADLRVATLETIAAEKSALPPSPRWIGSIAITETDAASPGLLSIPPLPRSPIVIADRAGTDVRRRRCGSHSARIP